jgi:uracil-DNA glycosylase family 4
VVDRARIGAVLCELRALGVAELFLEDLTAAQATDLLARAPAAPARRGEVFPSREPEETSGAGEVLEAAADAPGGEGSISALEALAAQASGCTLCRLSEGRTQVVFGRGSGAAELVVVGEAPGREEDRTGLPFVGPAGKLLDLLLLSVGFDRESVYICNVLKCRPPNNRDPLADEVKTCAPYLHAQLDAIQPRVLLAVGKFAAQMLSGSETTIGRLRGRVHEYRGIPVVATYHPAYLLRSPSATRKTWRDLQLMRQVMDEHA